MGPLQTAWVERLEAHPERQLKGKLGTQSADKKTYQACCLGELLICHRELNGEHVPFNSSGVLIDNTPIGGENTSTLYNSYMKYGLSDGTGHATKNNSGVFFELKDGKIVIKENDIRIQDWNNLAGMNDGGATWPQIAAIVREYPQYFFTKSV